MRKNSRKITKKTALCIILTIIFIFSGIQTAFALETVVGDNENKVNKGNIRGRIEEIYERPENLMPGDTVPKIVNVRNTGDYDSVIRLEIEKKWGDARDENGKLIVNDSLSSDNILINYNDNKWVYDEDDGYFYYKDYLEPNELTSEPIFEEFTIDGETTGNEYANKEADIIINMECVQATGDGISIWDKTLEELEVTYVPPSMETIISEVYFEDFEEGFSFSDKTNLLPLFEDLMPGETRTQELDVKNNFTDEVEIFLRADAVKQDDMDEEDAALVKKMLEEYLEITLKTSEGKLYYDGPIWGESKVVEHETDSLRNDVSLGSFTSDEIKKLIVDLRVNGPEMTNEYQELKGKVKWVWTARRVGTSPSPEPTTTTTEPITTTTSPPATTTTTEPSIPSTTTTTEPSKPMTTTTAIKTTAPSKDTPPEISTPVNPPKTGVESSLYLYVALMALSGGAMLFIMIAGRKKKKTSK